MSPRSRKHVTSNPASSFHEVISFRGRCEYEPARKVLYCCWNEGFFANCSVTLSGLIYLFNHFRIIPDRIDFSRAFSLYRNVAQAERETDVYPMYFRTHPEVPLGTRSFPDAFHHHNAYRFQNFRAIAPLIERFFQLASPIEDIESNLISKYRIEYAHTLAVCYRGTDKKTEVSLADPIRVLHLTERLLESNPGSRVWIQTDVRRVSDLFLDHFGSQCFVIDELPMTDGDLSMQAMLSDNEGAMRRFAFGQNLLAVTHMLSQCGQLINHTGNMAYWIWLFRGHSRRMWQFDRRGKLVSWLTPMRELVDRGLSFYHYRIAGKLSLESDNDRT